VRGGAIVFDDKWFERLSDQQLGRIWRRALQITLQRREERLEEMRERYERAEGPKR
jgi:hypothetical protein